MISFVTAFLGLVTGVQLVELAAPAATSQIEVRLDGELVRVLDQPPWRLPCDFGTELTTHELEAIAFDSRGGVIGRAEQLVNLPRPSVESQVLLVDWQDGRPRSAQLIWSAVEPLELQRVWITLDGAPLADRLLDRYPLPELDVSRLHFLSARLEFGGGLVSSAESLFGGIFGSASETRLTAIPVAIDPGAKLTLEALEGRLIEDAHPLRVAAVEAGPAEIIVVRDDASIGHLAALDRRFHPTVTDVHREAERAGLAFLMSARALPTTASPERQYDVYPLSPSFSAAEWSLPRGLALYRFEQGFDTAQTVTDATAVAGVRAAGGQMRRAVVLVVASCSEVTGRLPASQARRYLEQIGVPLEIWVTGEGDPIRAADERGFCRGAKRIRSARDYRFALRGLRELLDQQRIVWVEGRHLVRRVRVLEGSPPLRLVR